MSPRKTTAPPTPKHSRSSLSSRKGPIATEKTKKQSAKERPALDNRFHRTRCRSRRSGVRLVRRFRASLGATLRVAPLEGGAAARLSIRSVRPSHVELKAWLRYSSQDVVQRA